MNYTPKTYNSHLTFDYYLSKSNEYINALNKSEQLLLKEKLEHGAGDLKSEAELMMYLHSYGEIHRDKLLHAYRHLPLSIWDETRISFIDYGCGQGIAEMVLSDYLSDKYKDNDFIKDFTLIEPSKFNLNRCTSIVSNFYRDAKVKSLPITDKQINSYDISPECKSAIHILSNVIDLPNFEGKKIANILNSDDEHYNVIICVSPFYQENGRGKRMEEFGSILTRYTQNYKFEKHKDDWDKDYSCQIHIYSNLKI